MVYHTCGVYISTYMHVFYVTNRWFWCSSSSTNWMAPHPSEAPGSRRHFLLVASWGLPACSGPWWQQGCHTAAGHPKGPVQRRYRRRGRLPSPLLEGQGPGGHRSAAARNVAAVRCQGEGWVGSGRKWVEGGKRSWSWGRRWVWGGRKVVLGQKAPHSAWGGRRGTRSAWRCRRVGASSSLVSPSLHL